MTLVRGWIVAAPFLFAVGGVLYLATDMAAPASAYVRPLIVAVALAAVAFLVSWAITRSLQWGTILSSAFILFTFRLVVPALILVAIAAWWVLVRYLRRASARAAPDQAIPRQLAGLTAVAGLGLVAVTGWATVSSFLAPLPAFRIPEYSSSGFGGPNVYVILLDGHPRSDTLRETFGYDDSGFLGSLDERGFVVASEARSNYPKTWATLASAFNGTYVDRMLPKGTPPPVQPAEQLRWLSRLISRASVLDAFRARGYTIRTVPSLFVTTALSSADDYRDLGHLTEVEIKLITRSPWMALARDQGAALLLSDHRSAVLDSLDATAAFAEARAASPQLVFAHIPSPHTPFVFGVDDTVAAELPACFPDECAMWHPTIEDLEMELDDFGEGLRPQVRELDRMVIDVVDRIIAADPGAVVVLMSDHGIRYSRDAVDEHYRSFLAARSPDGAAIFENDDSTVNVFRRLATYVGGDIAPIPYERWGGPWDTFLNLELLERE